MLERAVTRRELSRLLQLHAMPLSIIERQREDLEALLLRDEQCRRGVEPAG